MARPLSSSLYVNRFLGLHWVGLTDRVSGNGNSVYSGRCPVRLVMGRKMGQRRMGRNPLGLPVYLYMVASFYYFMEVIVLNLLIFLTCLLLAGCLGFYTFFVIYCMFLKPWN
jgi:hypothetical protein